MMTYIYAFLFCGFICMIAQLILDNTKLTPGHVTSIFVVVGALLDVGKGKVDIHVIENMLDKDNNKTLSVVPAEGLYLEKIEY